MMSHLSSSSLVSYPSHIHYFIPGAELAFSTNPFHGTTWLPIRTYWTGLFQLNGFCDLFFIFFLTVTLPRGGLATPQRQLTQKSRTVRCNIKLLSRYRKFTHTLWHIQLAVHRAVILFISIVPSTA